MMEDPRSFCLALSFGLAVFGSFAAFFGIAPGRAAWRESAYRAAIASFVLLSLAGLALLYALMARDYHDPNVLAYVVHYTSRGLPALYTLTALWAGNDGSLFLWVWMLLFFAILVTRRARREGEPLWPGVLGTLLAIAAFFLVLIATPLANPFRLFGMAVEDGRGLNPMLQNPGMIFHPPALYLGYVAFAIPYAYAMATLIQGRTEARWFERTRRWSLFAWFFLSLGNLLGAWWAYVTLGWGGYWAWDPVENAGFLPWLTGTAFLHSIMIEERKGMLRVWNMVLIILTFVLTIFGTFLTRSGILSSVHAFAESEAFGEAFMIFLVFSVVVSLGLLFWRLEMLKSERRLDSLVSRESSFLFNNLLLVGAAFIVFWGTVYPIVSQVVRGQKVTVLAEWFNRNLNPVWVALLILTGLCPLIAWRRANPRNLGRSIILPAGVTAVAGVALFAWLGRLDASAILPAEATTAAPGAGGVHRPLALAVLLPVVFLAVVMAAEFVRGIQARMALARENPAVALWRMVGRNRRRYGGYIVHFGVALMAAGIVGSSLYNTREEVRIEKGGSAVAAVSGYKLTFKDIRTEVLPDKQVWSLALDVEKAGKVVPRTVTKEYHFIQEQWWTKPSILSTAAGDLYITLAEAAEGGRSIVLEVRVNPLVGWFWVGGVVLHVGILIAVWRGRRAPAMVPVAVEPVPAVAAGGQAG